MNMRHILSALALASLWAADAVAHPPMVEYWKAGTRRGRSAELPQRHARARQAVQPARALSPPPTAWWTEAWFSDSPTVSRRLSEMTSAITIPMIGETYPLPRGGGLACAPTGAALGVGLACVLQCKGLEWGAKRSNDFYASAGEPAPTLDHVRWVIVAPRPAHPTRWRAFVATFTDSLSRVMGPPATVDDARVTWQWQGHLTTVAVRGDSARVDSLEIECVSSRLFPSHRTRGD